MSTPYKRRRPSLIRNFWIYRWMVAAAVVLGLLLGFVFINSDPVTVYFPFSLGQISSTAGVVVLLGALAGSVLTFLVGTVVLALRHYKGAATARLLDEPDASSLPEERPPSDYAAKTTEGFSDAPWSKG
ncbi:MAG: DUF1049 domain-containing protein [Isosphaeraceae bacterium]